MIQVNTKSKASQIVGTQFNVKRSWFENGQFFCNIKGTDWASTTLVFDSEEVYMSFIAGLAKN